MLDKRSEVYNSGILDKTAGRKFAALVVTDEGIEVAAATDGLRFEYSGRWKGIIQGFNEVDRKFQERQGRHLKEVG